MRTFEVYLIVKADDDSSEKVVGNAVSEMLQSGLSDRAYEYIGSAEVEYCDELPGDMAPSVVPVTKEG